MCFSSVALNTRPCPETIPVVPWSIALTATVTKCRAGTTCRLVRVGGIMTLGKISLLLACSNIFQPFTMITKKLPQTESLKTELLWVSKTRLKWEDNIWMLPTVRQTRKTLQQFACRRTHGHMSSQPASAPSDCFGQNFHTSRTNSPQLTWLSKVCSSCVTSQSTLEAFKKFSRCDHLVLQVKPL